MSEQDDFDQFEFEAQNLRRRFRVMKMGQAWRASIRVWLATKFLTWGYDLIAPNVTPSARETLDCAFDRVCADLDTVNEGLCEARDIHEKRLTEWLGIER